MEINVTDWWDPEMGEHHALFVAHGLDFDSLAGINSTYITLIMCKIQVTFGWSICWHVRLKFTSYRLCRLSRVPSKSFDVAASDKRKALKLPAATKVVR